MEELSTSMSNIALEGSNSLEGPNLLSERILMEESRLLEECTMLEESDMLEGSNQSKSNALEESVSLMEYSPSEPGPSGEPKSSTERRKRSHRVGKGHSYNRFSGVKSCFRRNAIKIGFVGSGHFVASDVFRSLVKSGNEVTVWTKTAEQITGSSKPLRVNSNCCMDEEKLDELSLLKREKYGIYREKCEDQVGKDQPDIKFYYFNLEDTLAAVVEASEIIISCFDCDQSLEQALNDKFGLLKKSYSSKGYIEMTALSIELAIEISQKIKEKGGKFLEVSFMPSRNALSRKELILFTAGSYQLCKKSQHCFKKLAKSMFYHGTKIGFAAHINLLHQMMIGFHTTILAETLSLVAAAGVDQQLYLKVLNQIGLASPNDIEKGQAMANASYSVDFPLDTMLDLMYEVLYFTQNKPYILHLLPPTLLYFTKASMYGFNDKDISAVYEKGLLERTCRRKSGENVSDLK